MKALRFLWGGQSLPTGVSVSFASHSRAATEEHSGDARSQLVVCPPNSSAWQRTYTSSLVLADSSIVVMTLAAVEGLRNPQVDFWAASLFAIVVAVVWISLLALEGGYDVRFLGAGTKEYQLVARASFKCAALLAMVVVSVGWRPDRASLALVMISGVVLLLLGRNVARRLLARQRVTDKCQFRVLAVGEREHVAHLISSVRLHPDDGYDVIGVCTPTSPSRPILDVPVVGAVGDVRDAADALRADLIVVTASPAVDPEAVRMLGWSLEGSGIRLALAPSLTDVAGARISVHPVAGLPLVYVDETDLGLARSVIKGVLDRVVAAVGIMVALPVMLAIAVLIKLDSPGPVLFAQPRVGKNGQLFRFWKFRSMSPGSDILVDGLIADNECDGLLFKMKSDPRVTRVGTWLRRWSLDELPQLVNVLKGEMSLIGPRPLPVAPESFRGRERRRMLVKPGITGLWQVSGRSDVNWAEAVRLDLYYVDNWSLWLDLVILWKTISAVFSSKGAY